MVTTSDDFASALIPWVDECVEELAEAFKTHPYQHRVEHSLHMQLHDLLRRDPRLQGLHRIGDTQFQTQLIQKEWPGQVGIKSETTGRSCRQSFDLGILSPNLLLTTTREQFASGSFPVPIVIELGLDYGHDHLERDLAKLMLTGNGVQFPYVVHFSRKRTRKADMVEALLRQAPSEVRSVFVHLDVETYDYRFKRLDSKDIEVARYKPS